MRHPLVPMGLLAGLLLAEAAAAQVPDSSAPVDRSPLTSDEGSRTRPTRVLSVNPLGALIGMYSLEYEMALHPRLSVYVQPGVSQGGGSSDLFSWSPGPFLAAGARFFALGDAPTGLFLASGVHALFPMGTNVYGWYTQPSYSRMGMDLVVGGAFTVERVYFSMGLGALYSWQPFWTAPNPLLLPTARANVGLTF